VSWSQLAGQEAALSHATRAGIPGVSSSNDAAILHQGARRSGLSWPMTLVISRGSCSSDPIVFTKNWRELVSEWTTQSGLVLICGRMSQLLTKHPTSQNDRWVCPLLSLGPNKACLEAIR